MNRDQFIRMRVTKDRKIRLENAAKLRKMTLTAYIEWLHDRDLERIAKRPNKA